MPPSRTATRWSTGKWIAAILAVAVSLGFIVFLIFSATWQTPKPEAVSVELYAPPVAEKIPPKPAPEPPKPPPEPPRPQPEPPKPAPKVEPPQPTKADIALKEKQERERKQKEEKEKKDVDKREVDKRDAEKKKQERKAAGRGPRSADARSRSAQGAGRQRAADGQAGIRCHTYQGERRVHPGNSVKDQGQRSGPTGHRRQPGSDLRRGAAAHRRNHRRAVAKIQRGAGLRRSRAARDPQIFAIAEAGNAGVVSTQPDAEIPPSRSIARSPTPGARTSAPSSYYGSVMARVAGWR